MPFVAVHDQPSRIVRLVASGTVSRSDVIDFLTHEWPRLEPDWALLYDTTDSTPAYDAADVLEFVMQTVEASRGRRPQFAIVAPDPERYRVTRQYQLRCEMRGCTNIEVFRTAEDAIAWLELSRRELKKT